MFKEIKLRPSLNGTPDSYIFRLNVEPAESALSVVSIMQEVLMGNC